MNRSVTLPVDGRRSRPRKMEIAGFLGVFGRGIGHSIFDFGKQSPFLGGLTATLANSGGPR